jgi:hypothetical protein
MIPIAIAFAGWRGGFDSGAAGGEHDVREADHVPLVPPPAGRPQTEPRVPLVVDVGDLNRLADHERVRGLVQVARLRRTGFRREGAAPQRTADLS